MCQPTPSTHHNQGFSLVEVMVAIVLGLLLTAATLQLFIGNSATFRTTDATSRVQENARFAQSLFSKELRMTGYRGCLSKQNVPITNTLKQASTLTYNFTTTLRGYNNLTSSQPTELVAHLSGDPAPLVGTDLLLIQGPVDMPVPIVANSDANQVFANAGSENILSVGNIALITDCSKARIFQITGLTANGGQVNVAHSASTSVIPGNDNAVWDPNNKTQLFGPGSELMTYQTLTYFLAINSDSGQPALYRKVNGQPATILLDNIFNLQILYGTDTNSDRQVDSYQTANNITDWGSVLTLRLQLILGSEDTGVVTEPQAFAFNGNTFQATDSRWYMPTIITSVLRNRLN